MTSHEWLPSPSLTSDKRGGKNPCQLENSCRDACPTSSSLTLDTRGL